jgi:hypothetical protein
MGKVQKEKLKKLIDVDFLWAFLKDHLGF